MAEGQSRLIQQVAETSSYDFAEHLGIPVGELWRTRVVARSNPQRDRIRRVVQADILPRVSVGHVDPHRPETMDETAVRELVEVLLHPAQDEVMVARYVDEALARDPEIEHIFLRLFQPAARRLGELWCDDLCSFVDVTLGLATMQGMMRRMASTLDRQARPANGSRSALMTTMPGDQHTFGVNMAAEFFRRNGWDVCTSPWEDTDHLASTLRSRDYTVVGFSASLDDRLDEVAAAIRCVRRESRQGTVGVLVGGPAFIGHPENVIRVGADAVGVDARQALDLAEAISKRADGG